MTVCHNVFNVSPETTLLSVWPRDAKRLDTQIVEDTIEAKHSTNGHVLISFSLVLGC